MRVSNRIPSLQHNHTNDRSTNSTNRTNHTNRYTTKHYRTIMTFFCSILIALALVSCSGGLTRVSEDSAAGESGSMAAFEGRPPSMQGDAALYDSLANAEIIVQDQYASAQAAVAPQAAVRQDDASPASAGIGTLADPGAPTGRKVIYKANVSMKVEDFDPAESKLRDLIHLSGAYILQFNNHMSAGEKGATYVVKVPAAGFSDFIEQLRNIHKDMQLSMEGSDVTEEYVDLDARLKAKQVAEARLLAFMDKATGTNDLIRFQSELSAVQEQIEQLKGRMRYLDQNVAYSTVNIRMYESKGAQTELNEHNLGGRLTQAITDSARALGQFGQALLIFIAGLLPIIAIISIIGIPVYLIVRQQRRNRKATEAVNRQASDHSDRAIDVPAHVETAEQPPADTEQ